MVSYQPTDSTLADERWPQPDIEERERTFRWVSRGLLLFAAHAFVILFILLMVFYY